MVYIEGCSRQVCSVHWEYAVIAGGCRIICIATVYDKIGVHLDLTKHGLGHASLLLR